MRWIVPTDLASLCASDDFKLSGNTLSVSFDSGRRHLVVMSEAADHYLLSAVVVRRAVVASLDRPEIWAWQRNRASELVGFRVDDRGRLVAESWIPKIGLTKEEFQTYVRNLAAEADRAEHLLSGRDVE